MGSLIRSWAVQSHMVLHLLGLLKRKASISVGRVGQDVGGEDKSRADDECHGGCPLGREMQKGT